MRQIFFLVLTILMLTSCNAKDTLHVSISEPSQQQSVSEALDASVSQAYEQDEIPNPLKNIELPELPAEWQKAYANYLSDSFFSEEYQPERFSAYIEDINKDGIPEIFLYFWGDWAYPQKVLTYAGGKAVETVFGYYTSVSGCCFLYIVPETSQLVVKQTGHTSGTNGVLDYLIYDYTSDGYVLSNDLLGAEDWIIEEYGADIFICSINGQTVGYNEFAKAVDEHIKPLNMIDFAYQNYQKRIFVENIPEIIFSEAFER